MTSFRIEGIGKRKGKENTAAFWRGWEEVGSNGSNGPKQTLSEVEKKEVGKPRV